jgi:hypothetical protein
VIPPRAPSMLLGKIVHRSTPTFNASSTRGRSSPAALLRARRASSRAAWTPEGLRPRMATRFDLLGTRRKETGPAPPRKVVRNCHIHPSPAIADRASVARPLCNPLE